MELKVGLKFKKYYNENNINNIDICEVRGIVDDWIIVLFCVKKINKRNKDNRFYSTIDKSEFEFNVKREVFVPLQIK